MLRTVYGDDRSPERKPRMADKRPFDFAVIGGDERQIYLTNALLQKGYTVVCAALSDSILDKRAVQFETLYDAAQQSDCLLCPVPLSKNGRDITSGMTLEDGTVDHLLTVLTKRHTLIAGAVPARVKEYCSRAEIACYDLMERDDVAIKNAVATAEGTIAEMIARSKNNLHQSEVLVLGFGRCAQVLAKKLLGLDMRVTICARSETARVLAEALGYHALSFDGLDGNLHPFDYIVNTVPAMVLPRARVAQLSDQVTVVDIASAPGGVDFEAAKELGKHAALCLGLPGRYAPKTSGEILAQAVTTILSERSDDHDTE